MPDDRFELPKNLKPVRLEGFEAAPRRKIERPAELKSSFDEDELERKRRAEMMEKKDKP